MKFNRYLYLAAGVGTLIRILVSRDFDDWVAWGVVALMLVSAAFNERYGTP